MAAELTERVHGKKELENAVEASEILFGKGGTTEILERMDESTFLSVFEGVPQIEITSEVLQSAENVVEFLSISTQNVIFPSKGEARKMIEGGGVSINKNKISAVTEKVNQTLLQGKYLLIQKGKKNYFIIRVS